jgi:hypothetical protein
MKDHLISQHTTSDQLMSCTVSCVCASACKCFSFVCTPVVTYNFKTYAVELVIHSFKYTSHCPAHGTVNSYTTTMQHTSCMYNSPRNKEKLQIGHILFGPLVQICCNRHRAKTSSYFCERWALCRIRGPTLLH